MKLKIVLALAAVIGVFLIVVALQPSRMGIAREVVIDAPAEKVFPYINTRSLANSWNPFLRSDPGAKFTTEGPEVGVGAQTLWSEGEELGKGSATVVESVPNEKVVVKLVYEEPFAMSQDATYLLEAQGGRTKVTWKVEGEAPFVQRIFCMFMDMDKRVGDVFAQGLGELKTMVEAAK